MPLTKDEWDFLEVYIFEATNGPPFGGPATQDLARRGIYYSDLLWLLTAYNRAGKAEGRSPSGVSNLKPPPSPWANLEEVRQRTKVLKDELEPVVCSQQMPAKGAPDPMPIT